MWDQIKTQFRNFPPSISATESRSNFEWKHEPRGIFPNCFRFSFTTAVQKLKGGGNDKPLKRPTANISIRERLMYTTPHDIFCCILKNLSNDTKLDAVGIIFILCLCVCSLSLYKKRSPAQKRENKNQVITIRLHTKFLDNLRINELVKDLIYRRWNY